MKALVLRLCAGVSSFVGAAALTFAAMGEEAPSAPAVLVIECDMEESLCTVWPADTGFAAGNAGEEN